MLRNLTALFLLCLSAAGARAAGPARLELVITGFQRIRGQVLVQLSASAAQYARKADPVRRLAAPVTGETVTLAFEGLPPGEYAISVVHDENGNGKLDTNFFGMPTEAFGFSGDPVVKRGRPAFESVKFALAESGGTIRVRVAPYGSR